MIEKPEAVSVDPNFSFYLYNDVLSISPGKREPHGMILQRYIYTADYMFTFFNTKCVQIFLYLLMRSFFVKNIWCFQNIANELFSNLE